MINIGDIIVFRSDGYQDYDCRISTTGEVLEISEDEKEAFCKLDYVDGDNNVNLWVPIEKLTVVKSNEAQFLYSEKEMQIRFDDGFIRVNLNEDPEYPGVDIEFIPNNMSDAQFAPRVLFERPRGEYVRALAWTNPDSEDCSEEIEFKKPKQLPTFSGLYDENNKLLKELELKTNEKETYTFMPNDLIPKYLDLFHFIYDHALTYQPKNLETHYKIRTDCQDWKCGYNNYNLEADNVRSFVETQDAERIYYIRKDGKDYLIRRVLNGK